MFEGENRLLVVGAGEVTGCVEKVDENPGVAGAGEDETDAPKSEGVGVEGFDDAKVCTVLAPHVTFDVVAAMIDNYCCWISCASNCFFLSTRYQGIRFL